MIMDGDLFPGLDGRQAFENDGLFPEIQLDLRIRVIAVIVQGAISQGDGTLLPSGSPQEIVIVQPRLVNDL